MGIQSAWKRLATTVGRLRETIRGRNEALPQDGPFQDPIQTEVRRDANEALTKPSLLERYFTPCEIPSRGDLFCIETFDAGQYPLRAEPQDEYELPLPNNATHFQHVSGNQVMLFGESSDDVYYFDLMSSDNVFLAQQGNFTDYGVARKGLLEAFGDRKSIMGNVRMHTNELKLRDLDKLERFEGVRMLSDHYANFVGQASRFYVGFLKPHELVQIPKKSFKKWEPELEFPIMAGETPEEHKARIAGLVHPKSLGQSQMEIHEEAGLCLAESGYTLPQLVAFFSYYNTLDDTRKTELNEALRNSSKQLVAPFIEVFEICAGDFEMGRKLVEILLHTEERTATHTFRLLIQLIILKWTLTEYDAAAIRKMREDMSREFERDFGIAHVPSAFGPTGFRSGNFREILGKPNEKADEDKESIDFLSVYRDISVLAHKVVDQSLSDGPPLSFDEMHAATTRIIKKAIFKAAAKGPIDSNALNRLENLTGDTRIDVVRCGDLIESKDEDAMNNHSNYKSPNIFGRDNYQMVVANLQEAYAGKDDGWLSYLIRSVPKDLQNSECQFVFLYSRDGDVYGFDKPIGVCKIRPKKGAKNVYYMGTVYVDENYRGELDIGNILYKTGRALVPQDAVITGTVSYQNPNMLWHIGKLGCVGVAVTREGDEVSQSKELLELPTNLPVEFITRNRKIFSYDAIMQIAQGTLSKQGFAEGNGIPTNLFEIFQINSYEEFLAFCEQYLGQKYALTVRFSDRSKKEKWPQFIVFEKYQKAS